MQCSKRTISVHKSNSVGNINFLLLFATNSSFPSASVYKLLFLISKIFNIEKYHIVIDILTFILVIVLIVLVGWWLK